MDIGTKIKYLRDVKRLSQQELADRLDVSLNDISSWELDNSLPDILTVKKMCDLFNVSVDTFLGNEKNTEKVSKENSFNVLLKRRYFLPIIVTTLFVMFSIYFYSENKNIAIYDETLEELTIQTDLINNQINFNMKNKSINLPYLDVEPKELEEIKNKLIELHQKTIGLNTPQKNTESSIDILVKRQEVLLNVLKKQQDILVVYKALNIYYEKNILNDLGEFQLSGLKNWNNIDDNELLSIRRDTEKITNKTLNRSLNKAISHIEEQKEFREKVELSVLNFVESKKTKSDTEFEQLGYEIQGINSIELQNELFRLLNKVN